MTVTVANRLNGPDGGTPSASSLAASGSAGTVDLFFPNGRAGAGAFRYDSARTVHELSTVRTSSGFDRVGTPNFRVALPASGPWWARWYVWMPGLQASGNGSSEVRLIASFPDTGLNLVVHETTAGNAGTRLQSNDLAASTISWTSEGGSATAVGQWWRVELSYDGTDFVSRIYAGHSATGARIHTWAARDVGRVLDITGYRYRRGVWLQSGNNDPNEVWSGSAYSSGDTPVTDLQNALLDLGYELPQWGADGWYGQELIDAVTLFQSDRQYAVVDGIAGPETLSGVDLALRFERAEGYPPEAWLSHVGVSDSAALGPADPPATHLVTSASGTVTASGTAEAHATVGPSSTASGTASASGSATGTRHAHVSASGTATASGSGSAGSRSSSTSAAGDALASSSSGSVRHGTATASGSVSASSASSGVRHGVVSASGTATASGRADVTRSRAAIALDYARGHVSAPFDVVDDDQGIANQVTAKRTGGSEYRVTLETGRNSVQDPPLGIGRYEESVTLNAAYDVQMRDHAGWRVHVGSYDDARYPAVTVNLAKYPGLIENVTSRESGDWLQIINPPEWLPPEPIDLLIEGTEERLNVGVWDVTFNASSGGPWTVGLVDAEDPEDPAGPREPNRADTEDSVLVQAVTETDTTWSVVTNVGPSWIDSANPDYADMFPLDLKCGGEIIRVRDISGTGATQTFTVDRGLNGIRKGHEAGAAVSLARPAIVGL